jgi:CTP:molybdopterin cytidylyltransferase MocA
MSASKLTDKNREARMQAVVAAAGNSSRMGEFKPLLPLKKSTIIGTIIQTYKYARTDKIFVVTGRDADKLRAAVSGVKFAHNKNFADTDMLFSIKLGLAKTNGDVFLSPADAPLFSAETLRVLAVSGADVAIPTFNDLPGHPVFIKKPAVKHILAYSGDGGLKGALESYQNKIFVETDDAGIIYDADSEADYKFIKLYSEVPEIIQRHSALVCKIAANITKRLNAAGFSLDCDAICRAALLHDMLRNEKNHALAAADVLVKSGWERLAPIVEGHMKLRSYEINEISVLYLADKFAAENRIVTLDERYFKKLRMGDKDAKKSVLENYEEAKRFKEKVEAIIGEII